MLEVIEKLLVLQDRDRNISRVKAELAKAAPERQVAQNRLTSAQQKLEAAKHTAMQIESDRKKLELEVDARKQQIDKYSIQQFQTKKNDEYRALAQEIANCRAAIVQIEDQQLELMERGEAAQREVATAQRVLQEAKANYDTQVAELASREENLKSRLAQLVEGHEQLTAGIDESVLTRYSRLRVNKGDNAIVGIEHSVCGGCHMKLPVQIVVSCQGQREVISCPNCGRMLYYSDHMDLAVAD